MTELRSYGGTTDYWRKRPSRSESLREAVSLGTCPSAKRSPSASVPRRSRAPRPVKIEIRTDKSDCPKIPIVLGFGRLYGL